MGLHGLCRMRGRPMHINTFVEQGRVKRMHLPNKNMHPLGGLEDVNYSVEMADLMYDGQRVYAA